MMSSKKKTIESPESWDSIWMQMAVIISQKSKDQSTQVGAILVSPTNQEISTGFNGFPQSIRDLETRWERPKKYEHVIHAETNAILNAKKDLTNWSLYVTLLPCSNCANNVIQSGIKKVVYLEESKQEWAKIDFVKELFGEAGVILEQYYRS